ncbi:MAG: hypothetical protein KC589_03855 [Nanoarchaeota archaeon]|nr:hypothetical protein [Nanoarchaeota archaeon]
MKKLILIFAFLLSFQICFSFDLLNSKGEGQNYFSPGEPLVFVKTSNNYTNYSVKYILPGENISQVYNLTSCGDNFCGDFSLLDLINTENGSFSGSNSFNIILGNEEQTIYFDFKKPDFELLNWSFDKINKKLNFNFTYSDNFLKIKYLNFYIKNSSNLVFISNLNNMSKYSYNIENEGELELVFKIEDLAGNINEIEKNIFIDDFFNPKIINAKLILQNGNYQLEFEIKDKNLSRYEINQGSTLLSENIQGTSLYKKVNLPFNSGIINFKVLDGKLNQINKTFDLSSKIKNNYKSKYSSQKNFEFESSADFCILTKINGENIDKNFSKNTNKFNVELNINSEKTYILNYYCEDPSIREYFESEFIFDNTKPSPLELFAEKTDDGDIDLRWTQSSDSNTDIIYTLFRNGGDVYSGLKLDFSDTKVSYPKNYTYYVRVSDLAGNSLDSNEITLIPNKIYVELETNLDTESTVLFSNYEFELKTDPGSKVDIKVKNGGNIIYSNNLNNVAHISNINVNLSKGINEILITITDEFSNQRSQAFFINANPPEVLTKENVIEEVTVPEEIPEKIVEDSIEAPPIETTFVPIEEPSSSFWLWAIFWLVLLALFIWIIIFNEEKLKMHMSKITKSEKSHYRRRNDIILKKNISFVKKERAIKLKHKKQQAENFKNKKELGKYDKEKLDDLSYKRQNLNSVFSSNLSNGNKKNNYILRKTKPSLKNSKSSVGDLRENLKLIFMNIFKPKKEEKHDEFSNYLQKKHGERSWKTAKDYVQKPQIVEEPQPEKFQTPNDKENKNEKIDIFAPKKVSPKNDLIKKPLETHKSNEKRQSRHFPGDKLSLDDYLSKRKKKRIFYFAEKDVERDLRRK